MTTPHLDVAGIEDRMHDVVDEVHASFDELAQAIGIRLEGRTDRRGDLGALQDRARRAVGAADQVFAEARAHFDTTQEHHG